MSAAVALRRARPMLRESQPARRLLVAVLGLAVLLAGYFFYLRDSSLVAVSHVEVRGIDPALPGAASLRADLESAASQMTTLHVRPEIVERVASDHPLVKSVSVGASFPHSLSVTVTERRPAAVVGEAGGAVVVADDGVLLRELPADGVDLPRLAGPKVPQGARLSGSALAQAHVLGAAPRAFVPYLEAAAEDRGGVSVQLTDGIELRFGEPSQVAAKWRAAAAVLADPSLTALDYVDLTSPRRPAVGGEGHLLPGAP